METFLSAKDLDRIERDHVNGLSARAIVELFQPLGGRLSEATFRKYVQAGLLPRSRRVGRKGKHMGSQGLYPVTVVRSLNLIRKMMSEGLTLEQIRSSFFSTRNAIDELSRALDALLARQAETLEERAFPPDTRRELGKELETLREEGRLFIRRIERLASLASQAEPMGALMATRGHPRGSES